MSKSCVVCQVFPDHSGSHYSVREVTSRLFALRIRPAADRRWATLPNCFSAAGKPIMATAQMPESPEAHSLGSFWLLERPANLEEGIPATPTPGRPTAPGDRKARAPQSGTAESGETVAPLSDVRGDYKMAANGTRGYLHWMPSGLEVDIRAVAAGEKGAPTVEALKAALREFSPPAEARVTLTETLGSGQAWVSVAVPPGQQGSLLVCTGQIMERLVQAGVYSEVTLNA